MLLCSHCQKPLQSALWCGACQQLQSSGLQADNFLVFGLPPRYDVDLKSLEQSYHELAAELHPISLRQHQLPSDDSVRAYLLGSIRHGRPYKTQQHAPSTS